MNIPTNDDFAQLLALLGLGPDEWISICHQRAGEEFGARPCRVATATSAALQQRDTACVWFQRNPLDPNARITGRGKADDVCAVTSLAADVDFKDAAAGDPDTAWKIVGDIAEALGRKPAAVVHSGNGLHPYWRVDRNDPEWTFTTGVASGRAILRRFQRLCDTIAARYGATKLDNVSDLCRVLRVPGTFNRKVADSPLPVRLVEVNGDVPGLTYAELTEILDAEEIPDRVEDRTTHGEVVSAPEDWKFSLLTTRYVAAMIQGWREELPPGRHPWLVSCAVRIACAHRCSRISRGDHAKAVAMLQRRFDWLLTNHGQSREPGSGEVADALAEGIRIAAAKSAEDALAEVGGPDEVTEITEVTEAAAGSTEPPKVGTEAWDVGFWAQRPVLTHIAAYARSRYGSPFAVLSGVLRYAIAHTRPDVQLPPIVGTPVSVNLFTVAAGSSGSGKDVADGLAREAVVFTTRDGAVRGRPETSFGLGSGEGLAKALRPREEDDGNSGPPKQLCAYANEVGTLQALADRSGASLVGELLKAWMGQQLGFNNATSYTTSYVEAHSYRFCLGVGTQPDNAGFFMERAKDGVPQRFVWASATDPHASLESRTVRPDPMRVVLPDFHTLTTGVPHLVTVPPSVRAEITDYHHRKSKGEVGIDPLDGHAYLTRLKVAFGLALLETRANITEDDWRIAGQVLEMSTFTREAMAKVLADKNKRLNAGRAHAQADREAVLEERRVSRTEDRVTNAITKKLGRVGKATRSELRRACDSTVRSSFDGVFDTLVEEGSVVCCEGERKYALKAD